MPLSFSGMKKEFKKNSFTGFHNDVLDEIFALILFLFSPEKKKVKVPFRGFLLSGKPACGKTEMIKQVALKAAKHLKDKEINVKFQLVDANSIASHKWGEAEKRLKNIFEGPKAKTKHDKDSIYHTDEKNKLIILFDDIDCLFFDRDSSLSKEWTYSINQILFHQLDKLDNSEKIVIATSNKLELLDKALESRLLDYSIPDFSQNQLLVIMEKKIPKNLPGRNELISNIKTALESNPDANVRDLENLINRFYVKLIKNQQL